MKRISRLLSGPDSAPRWRAPALVFALVVSGTLLAAQANQASLPGVRIVSSTPGALKPGDTREITARGLDGDTRRYVASVDAQGRISETYEVDGKPQPITRQARAWVDEVSRMSVPPPPPAPPLPPEAPMPPSTPDAVTDTLRGAMPPLPPMPPMPPAPPEVPDLADTQQFRAILRLVAADPAVTAKLGAPIAVVPASVEGNLQIDGWNDDEGSALLSFDLGGPRGRANVHVNAQMDDGAWALKNIQLRGIDR